MALVLWVTAHLYLTPALSLPPSLTPIGILLKYTPSVNHMPQIPSWVLLLEPDVGLYIQGREGPGIPRARLES